MKASTMLVKYFLATILCITTTMAYASKPAQEVSPGIILYNQLKFDTAYSTLETEARSGSTESQYYLGEILRIRNRHITSEAQQWYEKAADNGSTYAIIQLGRQNDDLCKKMNNCPVSKKTSAEWLSQAKDQAMKRASKGDPESLYLMYEITFDRTWLEKSANSGYAIAQYWMAVGDRQGEGFFLIPGSVKLQSVNG